MISAVGTVSPALRAATIAGLVVVLVAFASIIWTPYPLDAVNVVETLADPSGGHWLGTDQLGRDIASLVMRSLLTSLIVAGVAVALSAIIGIPFGFAARRWPAVKLIVRAGTRLLTTLPAVLIAMMLVARLGPGSGVLMLALGLSGVPAFAQVTERCLATLAELDFVASARLAGLTASEIWRRHAMPEFSRVMLATALALVGPNVLLEAAVSFIGLGTQSPTASFGLMLRDAQTMAMGKPLLVVVPGLCLVLIAALAGMTSRGVRQLADQRIGGASDVA